MERGELQKVATRVIFQVVSKMMLNREEGLALDWFELMAKSADQKEFEKLFDEVASTVLRCSIDPEEVHQLCNDLLRVRKIARQ